MLGMELTILGSGTAVPSPRRAAPGYLLRVGRDLVVLDTGPGTMGRLLQHGVSPHEVSHILYSHTHLDHMGELPSWLFAGRIPEAGRTSPLTICGSAGFMRVLDSLRGTFGHWLDAQTYRLDLVTLDGAGSSTAVFSGWSVRAARVSHIESSLAYRIEDASGRSLVYSGDTDVCEGIVDLARDADLLLIESSFPDDRKVDGHLTPGEAGEIARRARARKVALTHFYPACEGVDMLGSARSRFDGETVMAEDGMKIKI